MAIVEGPTSFRLVSYFRKVNFTLELATVPIFNLEILSRPFADGHALCTLDLAQGYWLVSLRLEQPVVAEVVLRGRFAPRWVHLSAPNVMPYFQAVVRYVRIVLVERRWLCHCDPCRWVPVEFIPE